MTRLDTTTTLLTTQQPPGQTFDEEQMAAASFLARYSGRTLDAYRDDLRGFFQWAHDHHVEVMNATRPHIDGIISSNPAQYVRRPQVHPTEARGLDRTEFGVFLFTAERFDRDHAALAVLLGLNGTTRHRSVRDQHRRSGLRMRAPHPQNHREGSQTRHHPRSSRERHAPSISPLASGAKARFWDDATANASTGAPPIAG